MLEYQNRLEVPQNYRFNLDDFYANNEEWENTLKKVKEKIPKLKKFQAQLNEEKKLETFLTDYIQCSSDIMDLYVYAMLNHDVDLDNEEYIAMLNKISSVNTDFEASTSFFEPEIVALSEIEYQKLVSGNSSLQKYKHWLDEIYEQKKHTLSEAEEKILCVLSETFTSYEKMSSTLINSDHNYGKIKMPNGATIEIAANNIGNLKKEKDGKIRKKANSQFGATIMQYQNTESALLHNYVKNSINVARLRNFESPWERKLKNIHISNEVFENLKSSAKENKKAWQNYYRLMKKTLGLKTLHNYDTLLEWNDSDTSYSIEEAEKIILEALKPLGKEYQEKLKKVFDHHYIDYCGYKGKVNGGYSCSTYTKDSRIVLTFKEKFSDILTIAHEAGHNVHHQFVNDVNPLWYRNTSTFVAEVASLTNEFLVNNYIAQHGKTTKEKLRGIEHTLKTFQNNFFGAIREGEIEQKMYEHVAAGNTITANFLNDLVEKSFKDYLGTIIKDDGYSKFSWVTRSHYYMNFYLYSYAVCVVVAGLIADKITKKEEGILEKYIAFLKCGSNMYPEEVYEKLGIDLKDPKVFESGINFFISQIKLYETIQKEGE
ncbi:MAG: oligoendopeptidase F family protein [Bacilli bacterium]|nr:oligoendopeptidase F family protein [Bacilli bacterium]